MIVDLNPSLESDRYRNRRWNLDALDSELSTIRLRTTNDLSLNNGGKNTIMALLICSGELAQLEGPPLWGSKIPCSNPTDQLKIKKCQLCLLKCLHIFLTD